MKLKELFKNKLIYIGLLVLIAGAAITYLSGYYVNQTYHNLPLLNDFLLDNLPFLKIAWLFDLLSISVSILIAVYLVGYDTEKAPYFLVLLGIVYVTRAVFTILLPVSNPGFGNNSLFTGPLFASGLFFSGHTAEAFLAFLFAKGRFKTTFLVLFILVAIILLLARGHYSITVFSAIFFTYAIFSFGEKYLKTRLSLKYENES